MADTLCQCISWGYSPDMGEYQGGHHPQCGKVRTKYLCQRCDHEFMLAGLRQTVEPCPKCKGTAEPKEPARVVKMTNLTRGDEPHIVQGPHGMEGMTDMEMRAWAVAHDKSPLATGVLRLLNEKLASQLGEPVPKKFNGATPPTSSKVGRIESMPPGSKG